MRIHARSLLALSLVYGSLSAGFAADTQPAAVARLVAEARLQVTVVAMAAFRKISESPGEALIIDVREPDEFAAGHIEGAVNIPRGQIEFRIWPYLGFPEFPKPETALYLYCSLGSRSILAARSLQQLGLPRVFAVDMRLAEWQAAGYPLTEPDF